MYKKRRLRTEVNKTTFESPFVVTLAQLFLAFLIGLLYELPNADVRGKFKKANILIFWKIVAIGISVLKRHFFAARRQLVFYLKNPHAKFFLIYEQFFVNISWSVIQQKTTYPPTNQYMEQIIQNAATATTNDG